VNCPVCADEVKGERLGVLGRLTWYRCRDCGIDYHDDGLDAVKR
jgi:transposase-like protein